MMRLSIASGLAACLLVLAPSNCVGEWPFYNRPESRGLSPFSFAKHVQQAYQHHHHHLHHSKKSHHNEGAASLPIPTPPPTALYYDQLLDHFNPYSNVTFPHMYFINTQYVNPSSGSPPPFVHFILPQEVGYTYDPTLTDSLASTWGAISVTIEHRFYGNSIPYRSMDTNNLRFFTVEQALSDFVAFQSFIREKYNIDESIPWILDGCSYSGALSAWTKAAYPHLFLGAIAGSSVIEARTDFSQYVVEMGKQLPQDCYNYLMDARKQMDVAMSSAKGRQEVVEWFTVCQQQDPTDKDPLASPTHKFLFDAFLFNQISSIVQYGSVDSINQMCSEIQGGAAANNTTNTNTPLQNFGAYMTKYSLNPPSQPCLYVNYEKAIPYIKTQLLDDLSFGWQQCTQLGYMQTTEGVDSVLPTWFNLTAYLRFCGDVFNTKSIHLDFNASGDANSLPRVDYFNSVHGSHGIQLTNTLFINGGQDPYHYLSNYEEAQMVGLSAQKDSNNGVLFYYGYPHCSYGDNVTDLTNDYIKTWLTTVN